MSHRVDTYRSILHQLPDDRWEAYLVRESGLPGPRANLELMDAVAEAATLDRCIGLIDTDGTMENEIDPAREYLLICGLSGLGRWIESGSDQTIGILRRYASDRRWRPREAVAIALQRWGKREPHALVALCETWATGNLWEKRAVVAALCEPCLLADGTTALKTFDLLDRCTTDLSTSRERKEAAYATLRKALAYGWSVAVAARPEPGKKRME